MRKNNFMAKVIIPLLIINLAFLSCFHNFAGCAVEPDISDLEIFGCFPFGPSNSVAIKDNVAFVANAGVILIYNIADITEPVKISEIRVSGVIMKMSIRGELLYVAADRDGMYIFDIKDSKSVKHVIHLPFERSCSDIFLSGDLLFLGQQSGFKVFKIDDLNPAGIRLIKETAIPGQVENMLIVQDMLFVACGKGGLSIFNLKDDFKVIKHVYLPDKVTYALVGYQGLVYFSLCNSIYALNLKSFAYKKVVSLPNRRHKIYDIFIQGVDLYALSDGGIYRYRIKSPFSFRHRDRIILPGDHAKQAVLYNGFIFIAAEDAGVMVFDANIADKPVLKSTIEAAGGTTGAVVDKDSLFVSDYKGLSVYNIRDPVELEFRDKVFIKYPGITKARFDQGHVFILHETLEYGEHHVDILKIPEFKKIKTIRLPREPEAVEIESLRFPGENINILIQKNKLFVFTDHHLYSYDIKSIQSPKLERKVYLPGFLRHLNIYRDNLFITEYNPFGSGQDMLVFNLDNGGGIINKRPILYVKDNPLGKYVQEAIGSGHFDKLLKYGRYLYITRDLKLFIFLIDNYKLKLLRSITLPDAVRDISVKDNNNAIYIYLALEKTGLYAIKQIISEY